MQLVEARSGSAQWLAARVECRASIRAGALEHPTGRSAVLDRHPATVFIAPSPSVKRYRLDCERMHVAQLKVSILSLMFPSRTFPSRQQIMRWLRKTLCFTSGRTPLSRSHSIMLSYAICVGSRCRYLTFVRFTLLSPRCNAEPFFRSF